MIAGRELHLLRHGARGVAHIAAEIAAREIDIDVSDELRVLGADRRRTLGHGDAGHLAEWDHGAAHGRHQHLAGDGRRIVTKIPRVAQDDAIAFTALDRGRDDTAAERGRDDVLYIADRKAVARGRGAVGCDLDIASAAQPFGKGARGAGHGFDDALDLRSRAAQGLRDPGRTP